MTMNPPVLELTEFGRTLIGGLTFEPEEHRYTCLGKPTISATQLMVSQGVAPDYSNVPRKLMVAGADRGTMIHGEIERWIKTGEVGFTPEGQFVIDLCADGKMVPLMAEVKVTDGFVAGTFDALYWVEVEPGKWALCIVDNKTTSSIHWESVSWQLSIYRYLFKVCYGVDIEYGGVIWLPKEKYGKSQFRYVTLKPEEEVLKLIENEKEGLIYQQDYPVDRKVIAEIEGLKIRQAEIEERIAELNSIICDAMEKKGMNTFDTGYAKFTRTVSKESETFDSKKYMADHPKEDFSQYMKKKKGSVSLKITIKKENEK
jgi:hypothetical protein